MYITGTIVCMYMGNINLCTNMHNQIPPPPGGEGGGVKHNGIDGVELLGGLRLVPVVENNGGFSSRRPRVVSGQE